MYTTLKHELPKAEFSVCAKHPQIHVNAVDQNRQHKHKKYNVSGNMTSQKRNKAK